MPGVGDLLDQPEGCYHETSDNTRSRPAVDRAGNQARSLDNDDTVGPGDDDRSPPFPEAENASWPHNCSGTTSDTLTACTSLTAASHSPGHDSHAPSSDCVAATGEVIAASRHHPTAETLDVDCTGILNTLQYYRDLGGNTAAWPYSLKNMDLDQLRRHVEGEDAQRNVEQTESIGYAYYYIFLKSGAMGDLEHAIDQIKEQMPNNSNNPSYAPRLKDLIIMLIKKFRYTKSLDDLQETIFRAQEMVAITPPEHPDHPARVRDWIGLLLTKCTHTRSQDDRDDLMALARDAGAEVSVESDGGIVEISISMPNHMPAHGLNRDMEPAETELFNLEAEIITDLCNMSDEELCLLSTMYEDPPNDNQIGLYIYACFLIFTRKHSLEYLYQAIQLTKRWIAALDLDDQDRARGSKILNMISLWANQLGYALDPFAENRTDQPLTDDELDNMIGRAGIVFNTYEQTGVQRDLDEAIRMTEQAIDVAPRTSALSNLAVMLGVRFERTGSINDLNRIIDLLSMAVDATPQDHPKRAGRLNLLGTRLGEHFDQTGSIDNLRRSVDALNMALEATTPQDHPSRLSQLTQLGVRLMDLYQRTGLLDDLKRALHVSNTLLDIIPEDHPDRTSLLHNFGLQLGLRFRQTDSIDDLNCAIEILDTVLNSTTSDDPNRDLILNSLGLRLGDRFERTDSMDDLDRGINMLSMAIDATPQDNLIDLAGRLSNLGIQLGNRFERTGLLGDLDRSLDVLSTAMNLVPPDHPSHAAIANNLGNGLGISYQHTGSIDDLNHSIDISAKLVEDTPRNYPDIKLLGNLATRLQDRHKRTGSMDDLNRVIDIATTVVDATPRDFSQAHWLTLLGISLSHRFQQSSSNSDLDRSIDAFNMALDAVPQDYPQRFVHSDNLASGLGLRFQQRGSINDLNRAIDISNIAINTTPRDNPRYATGLSHFGMLLGHRFRRIGTMNDLDRAIDLVDAAVNATPEGPDRAARLDMLGVWLFCRFDRVGSITDLNRAIDVSDRAVNATPEDHVDRASRVHNLANYYNKRFQLTSLITDSDRAIELANMAVDASPLGHFHRPSRLVNLGNCYGHRFKHSGVIKDVSRAIDMSSMAINITPQEHPDRVKYLHDFGFWLGVRYTRTKSIDDLNCMLSSYIEGWNCRAAAPHDRIRVALKAAHILALRFEWEESSQLLEDAIKLLPAVSPRLLQHTDKQHMLTDFAGLASMGVAASLNAGKGADNALRLLELGRGIIAGLLMDMRVDISDLHQKYPALADEFVSLRDELDSPGVLPGDDMSTWETQAKQRREADEKFSKLMTTIRAKPEFGRFLLPPDRDELMAVADPDPIVVINLSPYRCDAFIIESSQIRVLELSGLKLQDAEKWAKDLRSSHATNFPMATMLEWLWDVVCRPCLDILGCKKPSSSDPPHVWWIPTGLLSQLPLHAAGIHMPGSTETVLDRVMSSYAPSIKALIHGRRRRICDPVKPSSDCALLIAMRETPGLLANRILPSAADEVEMLSELCPELQLRPIRPASRKADVLKHLGRCKIFHFAGHGESDPMEPSRSRLLLEDWASDPLTVGDLRDHRLQENESPPFLSYLSACSTGSNKVDNLADEGIHLVSAFQLAGFRHVVGTLWEVSDMHCVDVAKVLYETLRDEGMTDVAVCRGLHRAIRTLRDREIKEGQDRDATLLDSEAEVKEAKGVKNFYWVPYIHFGV
ncbi:CHAT domain-containing protein [Biscogniauxia marginata]|nr:CHAT domain-containing protein [Biscogniauxia marginata]